MNAELASYLETALWSSIGDDDNPLDDYSILDISAESVLQASKDVDSFEELSLDLLSDDDKGQHIGHDFWLTRNGHGAGFWDGDYINGDALTILAKKFKPVDMYVGDDGKVYIA